MARLTEIVNEMLTAISRYVALGLALVVLHRPTKGQPPCSCGDPACAKPGKHPRHGWKKTEHDDAALASMVKRFKRVNLAVKTGAKSGVFVLDIDPRHGGAASLTTLEQENGPLPQTARQDTGGGGWHLFFRHPGESIPNSVGKIAPGIDVRGDGGYVVVAPSRHQSGKRYRWSEGLAPEETPFAEAPGWLLALAGGGTVEAVVEEAGWVFTDDAIWIASEDPSDEDGHDDTEPEGEADDEGETDDEGDGDDIPPGVPEGQRNDQVFRFAARLRARGVDRKDAEAQVLALARRCQPPLPDSEAMTAIESAWRYPAGDKELAAARRTLRKFRKALKKGRTSRAFDAETLDAAAVLAEHAPAEFGKLKLDLRRAKLSVRDFMMAMPRPQPRGAAEIRVDAGRYVVGGPSAQRRTISNFVIEARERRVLRGGDGDALLVSFVRPGQDGVEGTLTTTDLIGRRDLIRALPSSEFSWTGTDDDVQRLRAHFANATIRRVEATSVMGRHDDAADRALIVLPGVTLDAAGIVKDPPLVFQARHRTHGESLATKFKAQWGAGLDVVAAKHAVAYSLPRTNVADVAVIHAGWVAALPFLHVLRRRADFGGALELFDVGTMGSGKSSRQNITFALSGMRGALPMKLPATRFTRLVELSLSNLVPVLADEYRPSDWRRDEAKELHHDLRSVYSGEEDLRGQKDLGVQRFQYSSPVAIAGEALPYDAALMERCVLITASPETLSGKKKRAKRFRRAYRDLLASPLECFPLRYWAWSLGFDIDAAISRARGELVRILKPHKLLLPVRTRNNLCTLLVGLDALQQFVGEELAWVSGDVPAAIVNQAKLLVPGQRRRTPFDDFVRLVADHVGVHVNAGEDYAVVKKGSTVVLRIGAALVKLQKAVAVSHASFEFMSEAAYQTQAKELEESKDSYVVEVSAQARFNGGRTLRGVALDVVRMKEQLNIDEDTWRSRFMAAADDE